jgi:serine/threonine protein phosphatase PrpC
VPRDPYKPKRERKADTSKSPRLRRFRSGIHTDGRASADESSSFPVPGPLGVDVPTATSPNQSESERAKSSADPPPAVYPERQPNDTDGASGRVTGPSHPDDLERHREVGVEAREHRGPPPSRPRETVSVTTDGRPGQTGTPVHEGLVSAPPRPRPPVYVRPETIIGDLDHFGEAVDTDATEELPGTNEVGASTVAEADAGLRLLTFGEPSRLAQEPWWSRKDWWKLDGSGLGGDVALDAGTVGDLAVCASALRGHKHRFRGTPSEDAFYVAASKGVTGDGYLVICIADGVSSAKHSAYGARRLTELLARHLAMTLEDASRDLLEPGWLEAQLQGTHEALLGRVRDWQAGAPRAPDLPSQEVPPEDLESTITFAIVPLKSSEDGYRDALIGRIGDSPALLLRDRHWSLLSGEGSEGVVVETATAGFFGTVPFEVFRVPLGAGDGLLLASDGIGNFITDGTSVFTLGEYLAGAWSSPVTVLSFLRDVSFDIASADDDRTAVMCWVRP